MQRTVILCATRTQLPAPAYGFIFLFLRVGFAPEIRKEPRMKWQRKRKKDCPKTEREANGRKEEKRTKKRRTARLHKH